MRTKRTVLVVADWRFVKSEQSRTRKLAHMQNTLGIQKLNCGVSRNQREFSFLAFNRRRTLTMYPYTPTSPPSREKMAFSMAKTEVSAAVLARDHGQCQWRRYFSIITHLK